MSQSDVHPVLDPFDTIVGTLQHLSLIQVADLDKATSTIASNQDESLNQRKKLAVETKSESQSLYISYIHPPRMERLGKQ